MWSWGWWRVGGGAGRFRGNVNWGGSAAVWAREVPRLVPVERPDPPVIRSIEACFERGIDPAAAFDNRARPFEVLSLAFGTPVCRWTRVRLLGFASRKAGRVMRRLARHHNPRHEDPAKERTDVNVPGHPLIVRRYQADDGHQRQKLKRDDAPQ